MKTLQESKTRQNIFRRIRTLDGLYKCGLQFANANHVWSYEERRDFEQRERELKRGK